MDYIQIENKIVNWLKDEVKSAGAKGLVVGMSGGIDSAVTAVLSKKAVGENMLGVLMPCYSNPQDMEDAKAVAEKFEIKTVVVNLEDVLNSFANVLGDDPKNKALQVANMKPRMRMIVLYYFANKYGYLVPGTDNKTEEMTGYFTKYGDGGVDILPIADLLKTEVRALARHLDIPDRVITKPPSAGLWDGQTDEGEMGITYDELDRIISNKLDGISVEKIKKYNDMYRKTEHKRKVPPFCKVW